MRKRLLVALAMIGVLVVLTIPFATPVLATAPTVTSIAPASGYPGQTILNVLIGGTHFNSPAATSVTFSGSGVTASSFVVNNDTQITAVISIAGTAATGARNVMVTNGDGTGTFPNGFSVNSFNPTYPNPPGGNTTGTSVSITAYKGGVPTVGPVYVGDVITYQLAVSFPATPATYYNFYGGTLAVSFPGSATHNPVAGYGSAPYPGGTPDYPVVPEISFDHILVANCPVNYIVSEADAVGGILTAHADYGSTVHYPAGIYGIYETGTPLNTASATSSIDLPLIVPDTIVNISAASSPILINTGTTLTVTESNPSLVINPLGVTLTTPSVVLTGGLSTTLTDTVYPLGTIFSGDTNTDGNLDPGETWQWTNIPTGNLAANTTFIATGHGLDPLGNDVTTPSPGPGIPNYPTETDSVPVNVQTPNTLVTISASPPELPDGGGVVSLIVTEHNSGQLDLSNVYVDISGGAVYHLTSLGPNPPGTAFSGDGPVLNVLDAAGGGETWQWIIPNVPVTTTTTFIATGYGEYNGIPVTVPDYPGEQRSVPVTVLPPHRVPASSDLGTGLLIAGFVVAVGLLTFRKAKRSY